MSRNTVVVILSVYSSRILEHIQIRVQKCDIPCPRTLFGVVLELSVNISHYIFMQGRIE